MDEYITKRDAELVLRQFKKGFRRTDEICAVNGCILEIQDMDTVDAVEVIRGTWEIECKNRRRCSHCGFGRNTETQLGWNYCPNCGSDNGW